MEARADELMYLFEEETENSLPNSRSSSCRKTPSSVTSSGKSKSHRRKRLRENLAKLAHEGQGDTPLMKSRRSGSGVTSASQFDHAVAELSATIVGNIMHINSPPVHVLVFNDCHKCDFRFWSMTNSYIISHNVLRLTCSCIVGRLIGWLVFNGTFSTDRLYRAMSAQLSNPITYLL